MWAGNPSLDALELVDFPGIAARPESLLSSYRLLGETAKHLAHGHYDLGIVLRFDHWWGAALLWAAGVPRRWGYGTPGMRPWLNRAISYVPGRHEVEQDLRLTQAVVGQARSATLQIDRAIGQPPLTPPAPTAPDGIPPSWLQALRRAIIHPGTGAANKLWTIEGWAQVVDSLTSEGWAVLLTGSPSERTLAEAIVTASNSKPPNAAGQTANLSQLVWVLDKADMVLGVDSGPLHIAAALDKPSLHLYGPSDERIWGPWGNPQRHIAFRAPRDAPYNAP